MLYWRTRLRGELVGPAKMSKAALAVQAEIMEQIRSFGYEHKPHIVNAIRCHTRCRSDANSRSLFPHFCGVHAHVTATFSLLWGAESMFRTFCSEATGPVDTSHSILPARPFATSRFHTSPPNPCPIYRESKARPAQPCHRDVTPLAWEQNCAPFKQVGD